MTANLFKARLRPHFYCIRYFLGVMPVAALKYFPKKDGLGKFIMSLICWTLKFLLPNKLLASRITIF